MSRRKNLQGKNIGELFQNHVSTLFWIIDKKKDWLFCHVKIANEWYIEIFKIISVLWFNFYWKIHQACLSAFSFLQRINKRWIEAFHYILYTALQGNVFFYGRQNMCICYIHVIYQGQKNNVVFLPRKKKYTEYHKWKIKLCDRKE